MRAILFIIMNCILFSCTQKKKNVQESNADTIVTQIELSAVQVKNAGIIIGTPVIKTMNRTIKANGIVDVPPQSLVSVSFPMGGYIKSTRVMQGSKVKKGEVIAVLEDQSYIQIQQDYLVAKARMEYLAADVKRQKVLKDQEAASEKLFQQITSEYKQHSILVRSLEEKLRMIGINPARLSAGSISRALPIRSPVNGYVSRMNINIGKYVNPSDVLLELVNPSDMHAVVRVLEKDLSFISEGLTGTVSAPDNPTKTYDVSVLLVTRNIDESRTGAIHCHFRDKGHGLLPGMFLVADIKLPGRQVFAVPEGAVVRYGGKQFVFTTEDGRQFKMQEVGIGLTQDQSTELFELPGIQWNDTKIVVAGAYALLGKLKNNMEE